MNLKTFKWISTYVSWYVIFYILLILYFADKEGDKSILIYLILIYIFGIFIQNTIVPIQTTYKTKEDLDKKINKLLHLGVKIFLKVIIKN